MPLLPTATTVPSSMRFYGPVKTSLEKYPYVNKNALDQRFETPTTSVTLLPKDPLAYSSTNLFHPIANFGVPLNSQISPSAFPPSISNVPHTTFLNNFFVAAAAAQFANYSKQKLSNRNTNSISSNIIPQEITPSSTSTSHFSQQTAVKANLMSLFGNSLINPFLFCPPSTFINAAKKFANSEQNFDNLYTPLTGKNQNSRNENIYLKTSLANSSSYINSSINSNSTNNNNNSSKKKKKLKSELSKENFSFSDDFVPKKARLSQISENSNIENFKLYSPNSNLKLKTELSEKNSTILWRPYDLTSNSLQNSTILPKLNLKDPISIIVETTKI